MKNKRGFASDNNAGIHPAILQAINDVNTGHVKGYGDDPYTEQAIQQIRKHFGESVEVFFVFTGTGANVLGLTAGTQPYNSIICAETAHIYVDECGAPEKFSGCKLLPVKTVDGKLTPELIRPHLTGFGFEHHSQPGIISISQSTEMGTVYAMEEIKSLADFAHSYNMLLHMDGARLANAAVSLKTGFKNITVDCGVDILSFGGTKNGLMAGESVLFFKKDLSENFKYIRKQGMQLASKMRFFAAQFEAYLKDDLWHKNAAHANRMAALLFERVKEIPEVEVTQKVQSNGVFARIPKEIIASLQEEYFFYMWNEMTSEARWMTSFDTTEEDIDNFVNLIEKLLAERKNS